MFFGTHFHHSPAKADFIRAKYQLLSFINRPKDENLDIEDYSKVIFLFNLSLYFNFLSGSF